MELVEQDFFAEWNRVHGHAYGTSKSFLQKKISEGKDVILDVDVTGGRNLKKIFKESSVLIFVAPPSWEELRYRLKLRGRDTPEEIELRLKNAKDEIKWIKEYDYVIINKELKEARKTLYSIIVAERSKTFRVISRTELFNF